MGAAQGYTNIVTGLTIQACIQACIDASKVFPSVFWWGRLMEHHRLPLWHGCNCVGAPHKQQSAPVWMGAGPCNTL